MTLFFWKQSTGDAIAVSIVFFVVVVVFTLKRYVATYNASDHPSHQSAIIVVVFNLVTGAYLGLSVCYNGAMLLRTRCFSDTMAPCIPWEYTVQMLRAHGTQW